MKKTNVNAREVRTLQATELRTVSDAEGKTYLEGYAALYNVRSSDLGFWGWHMYEVLLPGAFSRALREQQDVRHLINHDPSLLLGRTKSGTTELSEDEKGLKFRTLLPDTQLARDLAVLVARGDINECSFAFRIPEGGEKWSEEEVDGQTADVRTVSDVDLRDVSTVTYPAYPETNTHISMRALPVEVRAKATKAKRDSGEGVDGNGSPGMDGDECTCECEACLDGRCADCINEDCRDEACMHGYDTEENSLREKTKRSDGEDLTADAYLFVGDKADPTTWKVPVVFSSAEKTKSHVKDSLARGFEHVKDVSDDQKTAAWQRLLILAEKEGIAVAEKDKIRYSGRAAVDQATLETQIMLERVAARIRAIRASLD